MNVGVSGFCRLDDDSVMASGRSSGHAVHISTVFDHGAWVDMCDCLGMVTSPGELYGACCSSGSIG
jgi:hypothetical protein